MDGVETDAVVIRAAVESDLEALEWGGAYVHYRRVFRQTFDGAQRGQRLMLVAVSGEAMVGQVFVQWSSTERHFADGVERAYLYALRVRPEWQGRGVGSRLLAAAEGELIARGFTIAVIAAGMHNPGARRLYERQGYRVFAEDPGVWWFTNARGEQQAVEEPCWVMEKRLSRKEAADVGG